MLFLGPQFHKTTLSPPAEETVKLTLAAYHSATTFKSTLIFIVTTEHCAVKTSFVHRQSLEENRKKK